MPVEMSISCLFPEPGWQSRLMATEIWVSFVLRSIIAVRAAIFNRFESRQRVLAACGRCAKEDPRRVSQMPTLSSAQTWYAFLGRGVTAPSPPRTYDTANKGGRITNTMDASIYP